MRYPYSAWAAFVTRRYRAILAGSLLLCALSALSLRWLRLDLDVLEMLPRGRPAFDSFKRLVGDFGQTDELLVLVKELPGREVGAARLQAFADEFEARLVQLEAVASVQGRIDVEHLLDGLLGRYLPNLLSAAAFDEVARRLTPGGIEAQLAVVRAVLHAPLDLSAARWVRQDPLGLRRIAAAELQRSQSIGDLSVFGGHVMTPEGDALLMLVRPRSGPFDVAFSAALLSQVRAAEAAVRRSLPGEGVVVEYSGGYVYGLEDAATIRSDIQRYTLLALLGVLGVFYAGYRDLRILPFVTYPLLASTLVTFLANVILYGRLNAVSTSFAAILYGLSIDTGIHFYNRLLEERRRSGLEESIASAVAALLRPVLAASLTSAIVFAVIALSCLSGVSQLGVLTAFGVLLNPLHLLLTYPALACLIPPPVEAARGAGDTPRLGHVAELAAGRAVAVTAASVVAGGLLLMGALSVSFDASLMNLRPSASQAARVQDEIERRFGKQGSGAAVLVREASMEAALVATEAVVERLEAYRGQGLVRTVGTVTSLLPSEAQQRRRLARFDSLPRADAAAFLRAALASHGFVAEPFEPFSVWLEQEHRDILRLGDPALEPVASVIERHVRFRPGSYTVATYVEPSSPAALEAVQERLQVDLGAEKAVLAGRPLLESELGRVVRSEVTGFLILALAGNLVLLAATLGAREAMAILVPVLWAAVALLAFMSLGGVSLNPVNLVAPTLVLGLGVDYGAFMVARAREEGGMAAAVRRNGRALVVAALTTIAGFGCLSLSVYPALAGMGKLTAAGLLLCLLSSLVVLPALWTLAVCRRRSP